MNIMDIIEKITVNTALVLGFIFFTIMAASLDGVGFTFTGFAGAIILAELFVGYNWGSKEA